MRWDKVWFQQYMKVDKEAIAALMKLKHARDTNWLHRPLFVTVKRTQTVTPNMTLRTVI